MRRSLIVLGCLGSLALSAMADEAKLLEEARGVAGKMPPRLLEVLNDEIARAGHAGAIGVCRDKAPQMAKALSEQSSWAIRRVSLKNRNPKAVPDDWERAVLEEFEQRLAAGETPGQIDKGVLVKAADGQQTYRYMKALPTVDLCLHCHGTPDKVSPEVQAKLKELYPEDKALGYGLRQIRGAISTHKRLP